MKKILLMLGLLLMVPALEAAQPAKNTLLMNMSPKKRAEVAKLQRHYNAAPALLEEFKKLREKAKIQKDSEAYWQQAKEKLAQLQRNKQRTKEFAHGECRLATWPKYIFEQGCHVWVQQYEQYDQLSGKWIKFGPRTEGAKVNNNELQSKHKAKEKKMRARQALAETQPPANNIQNTTAHKDQKTQDIIAK